MNKYKNQSKQFSPKKIALSVAVSAVVLSMSAPGVYALSFDLDNGVSVDWDTTVGYSAAWRIADQNDELIGNPLSDDGNGNFDQGAMITNRFSVLSEADFRYENYGLFVRGSAFYDGVYFGKTDNDNEQTYNGTGEYDSFSDEIQDAHGKGADILDTFVYGSFDVADRFLNVRVGRQVVSWGESLFIPGISSAMSPADVTKTNVPGTEVKDILLPIGQFYAQFDLTDNLSISGYSQWEWEPNNLAESGSYFGSSDILDEAGKLLPLQPGVTATRTTDIEASDSGQWGVALNYYLDSVGNGIDLGFYHINYHEKNPAIVATLDFALGNHTYHTEFLEDVKLTGFSFSTLIGDTNIGGEIAYRKDAVVNPAGFSIESVNEIRRGNTIQAQLSAIHSFGVTSFADDVVFSGEIGYNKVLDVTHGADLDSDTMDSEGAGLAGSVTLKYNNVYPGTNLEVPISFSHNIKGDSAAGGFTNGQNADKMSVAVKAFHNEVWEMGVSYTAYFGSPDENSFTDRDFAAFNVKYSF